MSAESVLIYPNGREVPRSIPIPSTSSHTDIPPRAFTQQTAAAHGLYPQSLAGTPAVGGGGRGGANHQVNGGGRPPISYGGGGGGGSMSRDADMLAIERSSTSELPGYKASVPFKPSNLGGGGTGGGRGPAPPVSTSAHRESDTDRMMRELKDLMPVAPGDNMNSAGGASMFAPPSFPASPEVTRGGAWPEDRSSEKAPSNGRRASISPRHNQAASSDPRSSQQRNPDVMPDDIEGLLKQNEDKLSMLQHLNRLSGGGNPEAIEDFLLKFSKAKPTSAGPVKSPSIRVHTPQGHTGSDPSSFPLDNRAMSADRTSRGGGESSSYGRPLMPSSSFNRAWSSDNMAPGSTPMASRQLPPRSPLVSKRPSGGGGDALDHEYPPSHQRGSNRGSVGGGGGAGGGGLPPRGPVSSLPPHMSLVDKEYKVRPGTSDSMVSMQGATSAFLIPSHH